MTNALAITALVRCRARRAPFGTFRGEVTVYETTGGKRRRLWSRSVPIYRYNRAAALHDARSEALAVAREQAAPAVVTIA